VEEKPVFGFKRWRASELLWSWCAYWLVLGAVTIGPGLLAAWRATREDSGHGTVSAAVDNGNLLLTVTRTVGSTAEVWTGSTSMTSALLWIAVPPLLLWALWLVSRPRHALPVLPMLVALLGVIAGTAGAQQAERTPARAPRTILAIGAHAGDMELTAGAVLLKQHALGDHVVFLHLTLGEGGNPKLSPDLYGAQKRREALAAAKMLDAQVIFGPYRDGELPNTEEARRYVAEVIREVKPSLIITHWRESLHRDHATTHAIVEDAVLLASLEGVKLARPPHRGVRLWYAENWEDAEQFSPYLYVDVSGQMDRWRQLVSNYEFVRGGVSSFAYLEYYGALATVRGAEAHRAQAEAFDIDPLGKRRVLDVVP
jgi:N-acetylglucosamine malate deacetylase 1